MAEASAVNSEGVKRLALQEDIKKEVEGAVSVKPEPHECVVCATRGEPAGDVYTAHTVCGTALAEFLNKFAADLAAAAAKHVCRSCFDLINILEQAELEYLKLRETFEAIISKNPLFDQNQTINTVKVELDQGYDDAGNSDDSEDVPLAVTKKKRRRTATVKRKKKVYAPKRKLRAKNSDKDSSSWECIECGATGGGGAVCLAAHHLAAHALDGPAHALRDVKKEDSVDGSESSHFNNGLDSVFKVELDDFDDDDDDDFELCALVPRALSNGARARRGRPRKDSAPGSARKKREAKVLHKCDQCDAKYSTLRRLEVHREKHSGGKPPYICEVCGARYKHKRACDIHVALHKGISDWKCDECNKLFPSKGALQRHNNIHTGKLNYQCDLCGKSFIHTSSFKMHKLSHSGVKPHACDVCGLALMTRSHLKRHKRVHSGEKRHECGVCGKRFSERYNLAAHSKSHEGGEGGAEGAGAGVGAGGGGAEGARAGGQPRRRLFRCNFCQERFERRYMLERHMSVSHGRTLERVPPTPRNTMSKLLKAQAQARVPAHPPPAPAQHPHTPASDVLDPKEERSPDSRASSVNAHKMQLAAASTTITAGSWSSAYAAEFGLRHDFPH